MGLLLTCLLPSLSSSSFHASVWAGRILAKADSWGINFCRLRTNWVACSAAE